MQVVIALLTVQQSGLTDIPKESAAATRIIEHVILLARLDEEMLNDSETNDFKDLLNGSEAARTYDGSLPV